MQNLWRFDIQEVEDNIQLYAEGDEYSSISKQELWLEAMDSAYNKVELDAQDMKSI